MIYYKEVNHELDVDIQNYTILHSFNIQEQYVTYLNVSVLSFLSPFHSI